MKPIFLILCACLLLLGNSAYSQTVPCQNLLYLKNGSIIKGTIIEVVPNGQVKIETADGSLFVFEMSEVEKIEVQNNAVTAKPVTKDHTGLRRKGFTGAVELGVVAFGESEAVLFSGGFMVGYLINPHFSISFGAAAETGDGLAMLPLYLDFRAYLLDNKYTPFIALDGGYTQFGSDWSDLNEGGAMAQALIGGRFIMKKNFGVNLSLGYRFQSYEFGEDHGFVSKIGFCF